MRRFVIRPDAIAAGRVRFDADEAHHLARVLRLRPGALVEASDGGGRVFTVRIGGPGRGGGGGGVGAREGGRGGGPVGGAPRGFGAVLAEAAAHDATWLCWEGGGRPL